MVHAPTDARTNGLGEAFQLLAVVCNESVHWRLGRPLRRISGQSEG